MVFSLYYCTGIGSFSLTLSLSLSLSLSLLKVCIVYELWSRAHSMFTPWELQWWEHRQVTSIARPHGAADLHPPSHQSLTSSTRLPTTLLLTTMHYTPTEPELKWPLLPQDIRSSLPHLNQWHTSIWLCISSRNPNTTEKGQRRGDPSFPGPLLSSL